MYVKNGANTTDMQLDFTLTLFCQSIHLSLLIILITHYVYMHTKLFLKQLFVCLVIKSKMSKTYVYMNSQYGCLSGWIFE